MSGDAQAEMPKYKCHKEVWALKIAAIEFAEDGTAIIAPQDVGFAHVTTVPDYKSKFEPNEKGDLGYYVVYKDGYQSWSPTDAFEDGYTRI